MTTYCINLDDVDVALLPQRSWRCNDFLKKEYYEFHLSRKDTVEEPPVIWYTCHICAIQVPVAFARKHNESIKHRANRRIASVAAQRMRALVSAPTHFAPPTHPSASFCVNCSIIIDKDHDKSDHDNSKEHSVSIMHDKLLWDLMNAYVKDTDDDNANISMGINGPSADKSKDNSKVRDDQNDSKSSETDAAKNSGRGANDGKEYCNFDVDVATANIVAEDNATGDVNQRVVACSKFGDRGNMLLSNTANDDVKYKMDTLKHDIDTKNTNNIGDPDVYATYLFIDSTSRHVETLNTKDTKIKQTLPATSRCYETNTKAAKILNEGTYRQGQVPTTNEEITRQLLEKHGDLSYTELLSKIFGVDLLYLGLKETDWEMQIIKRNKIIHIPKDHFHGYIHDKSGLMHCIVCKIRFHASYAKAHMYEMYHMNQVMKVCESHGMRKVKSFNHCIICNVKVKDKNAVDHIKAQSHIEKQMLCTKINTDTSEEITKEATNNKIDDGNDINNIEAIEKPKHTSGCEVPFPLEVTKYTDTNGRDNEVKATTKEDIARELLRKHGHMPYTEVLCKLIGTDISRFGCKEIDREMQINRHNETIQVPMYHFHSYTYCKNANVQCAVCNAQFHGSYAEAHKYEIDHMIAVAKVGDSECMRKLSCGYYHCIICNRKIKKGQVATHGISRKHTHIKNLSTKTIPDFSGSKTDAITNIEKENRNVECNVGLKSTAKPENHLEHSKTTVDANEEKRSQIFGDKEERF